MLFHKDRIKVIIAGGGYAGLATLITLRQHFPHADILLIDPSPFHLRKTLLHEALRDHHEQLRIPFVVISNRFNFEHLRATVQFDSTTLEHWHRSGKMEVNGRYYDFDYLVLTTGAKSLKPKELRGCLFLEDLIKFDALTLLKSKMSRVNSAERIISVVGGGATSIQYLFELNEAIKTWQDQTGLTCGLRLITPREKILPQFPPEFGHYVSLRMQTEGIEHVKNMRLMSQFGDEITLRDSLTGREYSQSSPLTLAFLGYKAYPFKIPANVFGQVTIGRNILHTIFTAGDCSNYSGYGANTLSAQVAVRKGKKIAKNIQILSQSSRSLERYRFHELGYFVSLGPFDGVGWLGIRANVVSSLPAFAVKEAVETQFDLLLAGVDTYVL